MTKSTSVDKSIRSLVDDLHDPTDLDLKWQTGRVQGRQHRLKRRQSNGGLARMATATALGGKRPAKNEFKFREDDQAKALKVRPPREFGDFDEIGGSFADVDRKRLPIQVDPNKDYKISLSRKTAADWKGLLRPSHFASLHRKKPTVDSNVGATTKSYKFQRQDDKSVVQPPRSPSDTARQPLSPHAISSNSFRRGQNSARSLEVRATIADLRFKLHALETREPTPIQVDTKTAASRKERKWPAAAKSAVGSDSPVNDEFEFHATSSFNDDGDDESVDLLNGKNDSNCDSDRSQENHSTTSESSKDESSPRSTNKCTQRNASMANSMLSFAAASRQSEEDLEECASNKQSSRRTMSSSGDSASRNSFWDNEDNSWNGGGVETVSWKNKQSSIVRFAATSDTSDLFPRLEQVKEQEPAIASNARKLLLLNPTDADVTIVCPDGKTFSAHKFVLATASDYFRAYFHDPRSSRHRQSERHSSSSSSSSSSISVNNRHNDGHGRSVWHTNYSSPVMRALLSSVYSSGVPVAIVNDYASELLSAAHEYQLFNLVHICEVYCIRKVSSTTVKSMLRLAHSHECHDLEQACFDFVRANVIRTLTSPDFVALATEDVELWNKLTKALRQEQGGNDERRTMSSSGDLADRRFVAHLAESEQEEEDSVTLAHDLLGSSTTSSRTAPWDEHLSENAAQAHEEHDWLVPFQETQEHAEQVAKEPSELMAAPPLLDEERENAASAISGHGQQQERADEAAREEEATELAASLLRPLSEDERQIVDDAIMGQGPPGEILAKVGTDSVQRQSMHYLQNGEWLRDELINFYYVTLRKRDEELCRLDPSRKRSHFFKSFFLTKLLNEGHATKDGQYEYNNVKRWSNKVPGKDIFKLDKMFFPINVERTHWMCAVVNMTEKRIEMYDSLGSDGMKYLKALFQYI